MKVKISSNIVIEDYDSRVLDYAENYLVFANPKYYLNEKIKKSNWKVPKNIVLYQKRGKDLILPFGTYRDIFPLIKDCEISAFKSTEETKELLPRTILRPYQNRALESVLKAKNGVLVAPCGSGKTLIGMNIIAKAKRRTLWIVHTLDLVNQAKIVAEREFINLESGDIGMITEGKVNVGNIITFATIQTLSNIDLTDFYDYWDVIIVDECAHCCGTPTKITMFYSVLSQLQARYKIGLTATPKRVDGLERCMFALLGSTIYEITEKEVNTIKCPAHLEIVDLPTSDCLEYYASDYEFIPHKFDEYIATNRERNVRIASKIRDIAREGGHHQLVLCVRIAQCDELVRILQEMEVNAVVFNGQNSHKKNEEILRYYKTYDVIVATYSVASEGLDMPALDTLHLASPKGKRNKALIQQCIGRVERASPDKDQSNVYVYRDSEIPHSAKFTKLVQLAMGKKGYIYPPK